MKRFLLILVSFVSVVCFAQDVVVKKDSLANTTTCVLKFGYLSYDAAIKAMPEYAEAQKSIEALKAKYDAEAKRVEDEFNKKYEEFLEGQREFPQTILRKRQNELQELLSKNIAFKNESLRLLAEAEKEAMAPLHKQLAALLSIIGADKGFSFIINTDNNSCPFINPQQGVDINGIVKSTLQAQ